MLASWWGCAVAAVTSGDYAQEKLQTAVLILAVGSGTLRERLEDAYLSSLIRLRAEHHFPWPDLRQRFEDLMEEIAPGGDFRSALAAWPELDLSRIAESVVSLNDRVAREMHD